MKTEYAKGEKIRKYKASELGKWTSYSSAIDGDLLDVLKYAEYKSFIRSGNDAPRRGRMGDFFEILKPFSLDEMRAMRDAEVAEKENILSKLLPAETVSNFETVSDVGSFRIGGELVPNFSVNGSNRVEVCKCDSEAFAKADIITRRQIYNTNSPLRIVKFGAPVSLVVHYSDADDSLGSITIDSALGYAVWSRHLKVFVKKEA